MAHETAPETSPTFEPASSESQGDVILAGHLDVMLIYHHTAADTYHPAFYTERPLPGPGQPFDQLPVVRLASRMHHTTGSPTLEGAQQLLRELRERIQINDLNVASEHPLPWDGELGDIMLVPNWRIQGDERPFASLLEPGGQASNLTAPRSS